MLFRFTHLEEQTATARIMVTTRNKRKPNTQSERISYEETQNVYESALAEAEKILQRKAKKRRKESWQRNHPPFEMLPVDVLPKVMLYLDSARDVYNLSLCSKSLRAAVSTEIVVRAAVFQGGKAK